MTDFSADLDKVIRSRAVSLIGPWPDRLTMLVMANESGFHVSLGPVDSQQTGYYRSRVRAIIADIKLECTLMGLRRRAREAALRSLEN